MRRHILDENGLTPAEERFVGLIARGYTQRQAAKEAFPCSKLSDSGFDDKAHRLRKRPAIEARLRALLMERKISDIDSEGLWHSDLADMITSAKARENDTALASFMRLRGQALGILKDRVVISAEQVMPDADLIKQLAGGDKQKAAMLQSILGRRTFDA
ncbi:MAG: hypothetical protein IIA00_01585 [Proteobacteria bacterium]|nr:hypothetical protein [Pseudomonadota bacterium]